MPSPNDDPDNHVRESPTSADVSRPFECTLQKLGIVLPTGITGAWDAGMVESPAVWFDEARGKFGMVYTGYEHAVPERRGYESVSNPRVGLAWSDDLVKWEKDPANPIFGPTGKRVAGSPSGGLDTHGTAGPVVFVHNGRYHLYYFSTSKPGYERGVKAMHHAVSDDLYNWQRNDQNPIISPAGEGWRRDAIWHPHVVERNGLFFLFFNASGVIADERGAPFEEETIGVASSTDLFSWQVHDDISPLLVGSRRQDAWDSTGRTGDPSLWRQGDTWFMAYYSWDGVSSRDGIASTTDAEFPDGWRPSPTNPILDIGAPDSFDALHAGKPYVVRTDTTHFHFYTAVAADESRMIAVASCPLR